MLKKLKRYLPIRFVVAVPIFVILVGAWLVAGVFAKGLAEKGASAALGTDVTFGSLSFSPLTGSIALADFAVRDEDRPGQNLLIAKDGRGALSIWQLLRGRVVIDQLKLSDVRFHVERREDGSLNVEDVGEPEEPAAPEEKEKARLTDWLETARTVAEKLQSIREKARKRDRDRREGKREPPTPEELARGRSDYVILEEPNFVIRKISLENLEIEIDDRTKDEKLPPLIGNASIENISSSPLYHDSPISFNLSGAFGELGKQGSLSLDGLFDAMVGTEAADTKLDLKGNSLDLGLLKPLFGVSLPVKIEKGNGDLRTSFVLTDFSRLLLHPSVVLSEMRLAPDGKNDRVFGIPAADFCDAVNRAKSFTIQGVTIGGTLMAPEFSWSPEFQESLKKLLVDAGKGYLTAEAEKHFGKEAAKIQAQAEKILGDKLGKELGGKTVEGAKGLLDKGLNLVPGLGGKKDGTK